MKVFFLGLRNIQDGYLCMDLLLWTMFGQHWVGNLSSSFPTAPPHPQGTRIRGSQLANKIWRRSAGHCRIILLCQPSHSAEYMLNSAAGWGPGTSLPSSWRASSVFAGAALLSAGAVARESAAPEEPPPAPHTAPGTGPQPPQREDWAPLQNKCLPISDTYWLYL